MVYNPTTWHPLPIHAVKYNVGTNLKNDQVIIGFTISNHTEHIIDISYLALFTTSA